MRKAKTKRLVEAAFHEVVGNVPARVKQTKRKRGAAAARKQMVAIALDKARRAVARLKKRG